MANMTLGAYTFESNPAEIDGVIQKVVPNAKVDTYASVAHFAWPALYAGQEKVLDWDYMTTDQYETHLAQYEAAASLVWDPGDGHSPARTFNVVIRSFTGKYHLYMVPGTDREYKDVTMKLLILSEV